MSLDLYAEICKITLAIFGKLNPATSRSSATLTALEGFLTAGLMSPITVPLYVVR